jgi:hypothetical protein
MNTQAQTAPLYPETEKFMQWYNAQKERGLLDVKFFVQGTEATSVTAESFLGEVNRAISAEPCIDTEVLLTSNVKHKVR